MAKKEKSYVAKGDPAGEIEQLKRRLNMLDDRLDNIDSMVTAVAERVTKQPITVIITCPECGKDVEIALLGIKKPTK